MFSSWVITQTLSKYKTVVSSPITELVNIALNDGIRVGVEPLTKNGFTCPSLNTLKIIISTCSHVNPECHTTLENWSDIALVNNDELVLIKAKSF